GEKNSRYNRHNRPDTRLALQLFPQRRVGCPQHLQPGNKTLEQYQFGGSVGGPIRREKSFYFLNYEGQRRREAPFYNSFILSNIARPNAAKANSALQWRKLQAA